MPRAPAAAGLPLCGSQSWGATSDIPVIEASIDDVQELLEGALFKALHKWMIESGAVYLQATGPVSSFLVVFDLAAAKHVLRGTDNPRDNIYIKGFIMEVSLFLFGKGFAVAVGAAWKVCRKVVAPSLHKKYLTGHVRARVQSQCAAHEQQHCCPARQHGHQHGGPLQSADA